MLIKKLLYFNYEFICIKLTTFLAAKVFFWFNSDLFMTLLQ